MNVLEVILLNVFYMWYIDGWRRDIRQDHETFLMLVGFNVPLFLWWSITNGSIFTFLFYNSVILFVCYVSIIGIATLINLFTDNARMRIGGI